MHNPKFRKLIRRVNWYLPYLGMGIRVVSASDDFTRFEADLSNAEGEAVARVSKEVYVRAK